MIIKWKGHDIIQCNVPGLSRDCTVLGIVRLVEEESDIDETSDDEEDGEIIDNEDAEERDPLPIEELGNNHSEQVRDNLENKDNEKRSDVEEGEQERKVRGKMSMASED